MALCWLITVTRISPVATQFWAPPSNLSTVILFINRTKSGASMPDNTDHLEVRIQDLQKSTIVQRLGQVILECSREAPSATSASPKTRPVTRAVYACHTAISAVSFLA